MITTLSILNNLEKLIAEHLNDYLDDVEGMDVQLPQIGTRNVSQDFPDTDSMPMPNMINIVATYSENEELSVGSDLSTLNVSVFISCKREKSSVLQKRVLGYVSAFELLLWHHQNLDGLTDMCDVVSCDYYPAIAGDVNVSGVEISLAIQYAKEYV